MTTLLYRLLKNLHRRIDSLALTYTEKGEYEIMYHRLSGKWMAATRYVSGAYDPTMNVIIPREGGPTWQALVFRDGGLPPVEEEGFASKAEADAATRRLVRTHLGVRIIHEREAT